MVLAESSASRRCPHRRALDRWAIADTIYKTSTAAMPPHTVDLGPNRSKARAVFEVVQQFDAIDRRLDPPLAESYEGL